VSKKRQRNITTLYYL